MEYELNSDLYDVMQTWIMRRESTEWEKWIKKENGSFEEREEWLEWDPMGSSLGDKLDQIKYDWLDDFKELSIQEVKAKGKFYYNRLVKESEIRMQNAKKEQLELERLKMLGDDLWVSLKNQGFPDIKIERRNKKLFYQYTDKLDLNKEQLKALALSKRFLFSNSMFYELTQ